MARKQSWEKRAWEWALKTEPENVGRAHVNQAYRVSFKPCRAGSCRKNCRGNPNCLSHLGEAKWLLPKEVLSEPESDTDIQGRPKDGFVGLRNLGATCYVNSLLQVWFHNPVFRSAVFAYRGATIPTLQKSSLAPWKHKPNKSNPTIPVSDPGRELPSQSSDILCTVIEDRSTAREPPRKRLKWEHREDCVSTAERTQGGSGEVMEVRGEGGEGEESDGPATPPDLSAVIGHLQLLFAKLQYANRSYIDPVEFIDSLSLHHGQQQDAQEFRKLFLSLLESAFQQQKIPVLQRLIQQQFGGTYAYVTRCEGCGGVSAVDSQFYELELSIQRHKLLSECLAEFFQEESLSGDNQYLCSRCGRKQDAKRFIRLKALPPVLTLQLMRFVFDTSLLAKVKVTSYLVFPDTLDLTSYIDDPSAIYQLSAVIVHCGPSAYSGHYIPHIKDPKSGGWFQFDDDAVARMKGEKLVLGSQEDFFGPSGSHPKKPRCPKGHHMSNNAYMLVYTKIGTLEGVPEPVASSELQEMVATDNSVFQQLLDDTRRIKVVSQCEAEARRREMERLYRGLAVKPEVVEGYDWVRTLWLQSWLGGGEPGRCEHEDLLCRHNNISPDKVTEVKRVNSKIIQELYGKHSRDSLRLSSEMLCVECVVERCREIRLQDKVTADHKTISLLLKTPCISSVGFWVGRKSLQSWRRLFQQSRGMGVCVEGAREGDIGLSKSTESVTASCVDVEETYTDESGGKGVGGKLRDQSMVNSGQTDRNVTQTDQNVTQLKGGRRRVGGNCLESAVVSESLQNAAPGAVSELEPTAPRGGRLLEHLPPVREDKSAVIVLDSSEEENFTCPYDLEEATSDEKRENEITNSRVSSSSHTTATEDSTTDVVERESSEPAPKAEGDSKASSLVEFNVDLLCEHGDLCLSDGRRRLVPEGVWHILQWYFPSAREFPVLHPPCALCRQAREGELEQLEVMKAVGLTQKNELPDLYHFRSRPHPINMESEAYVVPASFVDDWIAFVRYPSKNEQPSAISIGALLCEHGGFPFNITVDTWNNFGEHLVYVWQGEWNQLLQWYPSSGSISLRKFHDEDGNITISPTPSYCEECHQLRAALEQSTMEDFSSGYIYVYQPHEEDEEQLLITGKMETSTRSLRRRIPVGAKKIQVSSSQTLQQLKSDVLHLFQVFPSDQQLYLRGRQLEGEEKTLGELLVPLRSTIILKVKSEEESFEQFIRETAAAAKDQVEGGFKGTGLLQ